MHWQGGFADLVDACQRHGAPGAGLARILAPAPHHYHVLKPKHSGFMHTALEVLLAQLGVDALVVTGLATDSCVLATALDAHMRDYILWVPSDCAAAITPARHARALALLRSNTPAVTAASRRVAGTFPASPA